MVMVLKPIDIVVPVHNALDYVQTCLTTLYETTENFRLIVVDDYSNRETKAYLASELGHHRIHTLVSTSRQRWFTEAANTGLRLVKTDMVILLNSDCHMHPGWLEELRAVWDLGREVGKVGLVGSMHSPGNSSRWQVVSEPNYVTGHCLLLSLPILQEVASQRHPPGGFLDDTRSDAIHINSDRFLSYEINRLGYQTIIAHHSAVSHAGGRSWSHELGKLSGLSLESINRS
jgi:glycosyltransferase involved in cell wall biosynthesis